MAGPAGASPLQSAVSITRQRCACIRADRGFTWRKQSAGSPQSASCAGVIAPGTAALKSAAVACWIIPDGLSTSTRSQVPLAGGDSLPCPRRCVLAGYLNRPQAVLSCSQRKHGFVAAVLAEVRSRAGQKPAVPRLHDTSDQEEPDGRSLEAAASCGDGGSPRGLLRITRRLKKMSRTKIVRDTLC